MSCITTNEVVVLRILGAAKSPMSAYAILDAVRTTRIPGICKAQEPMCVQASTKLLPAERSTGAIGAGLRYARHSPALRSTLMRAAGFFLFASTYWALLPLVARTQITSGPTFYGILLGAIGAGAVGGAFVMPQLNQSLRPDRLMAAGMLGTVATLTLYGIAHGPVIALIARRTRDTDGVSTDFRCQIGFGRAGLRCSLPYSSAV